MSEARSGGGADPGSGAADGPGARPGELSPAAAAEGVRARVLVLQNDPAFGETARNLEAARAALAGRRADLVVLPELFATGYQFASREEVLALAEPFPGGATAAALREIARESGAAVVAGVAERVRSGAIYNSAAVVLPSGFLATYRKLHLFAEERTWFAPGDRLPPVIWTPSGLRVGVMICFDWRFPEVARHLALEGADLLAHPSNLVRPYAPDAMVTRCLENLVFAATANRVGEEARGGRSPLRYIGRSQVVSPRGERLGALGPDAPGILEVEVDISLARGKGVTGCEDLLLARRRDLLALEARRDPAPARRATLARHEAPAARGGPHWDLFVEKEDGSLASFRLEERPRPGLAAARSFDHRPEVLDFEGDLGGGRGAVAIAARGAARALGGGTSAGFELSGDVAGGGTFRLAPAGAAERWRIG